MLNAFAAKAFVTLLRYLLELNVEGTWFRFRILVFSARFDRYLSFQVGGGVSRSSIVVYEILDRPISCYTS